MEDIFLNSEEYKVISKEYKGKAKGWKDIKDGNVLKFSFKLKNNIGFGRTYQSYIKIIVMDSDKNILNQFHESISQLCFKLDYFKLEKI